LLIAHTLNLVIVFLPVEPIPISSRSVISSPRLERSEGIVVVGVQDNRSKMVDVKPVRGYAIVPVGHGNQDIPEMIG
jgi:hypothetical protein